jgi:TIR domain
MPDRRKVFISHSRAEQDVARQLSDVLRSHDFQPWSTADLRLGADAMPEITQCLRSADAIVVLIGESSPDSDSVRREWAEALEHAWAHEGETALVPVVIGDADVPAFVRRRQPIRLDRPDAASLELVARHVEDPSAHAPRAHSEEEQRMMRERYAEIRRLAATTYGAGDPDS